MIKATEHHNQSLKEFVRLVTPITVCKAVYPGSNPGVASNFHSGAFSMINSINGWVEDNRNLGMFSKIINGEHVQTYVAPDGNVHESWRWSRPTSRTPCCCT